MSKILLRVLVATILQAATAVVCFAASPHEFVSQGLAGVHLNTRWSTVAKDIDARGIDCVEGKLYLPSTPDVPEELLADTACQFQFPKAPLLAQQSLKLNGSVMLKAGVVVGVIVTAPMPAVHPDAASDAWVDRLTSLWGHGPSVGRGEVMFASVHVPSDKSAWPAYVKAPVLWVRGAPDKHGLDIALGSFGLVNSLSAQTKR